MEDFLVEVGRDQQLAVSHLFFLFLVGTPGEHRSCLGLRAIPRTPPLELHVAGPTVDCPP